MLIISHQSLTQFLGKVTHYLFVLFLFSILQNETAKQTALVNSNGEFKAGIQISTIVVILSLYNFKD